MASSAIACLLASCAAVHAFAPSVVRGPRLHPVASTATDFELDVKRRLGKRGPRVCYCVEFAPAALAPGLEFMRPVLFNGASTRLREEGFVAAVACGDLDALTVVAAEQATASGVREACAVLYIGSDSIEAAELKRRGAHAALVRLAEGDMAARCVELRAAGVAPVPVATLPLGADSRDASAAVAEALRVAGGSVAAIVLDGCGELTDLAALSESGVFGEKREFSLLRAVQLGTPDLDAAGGACAAAKYDGVLLTAPSPATTLGPEALADKLIATLEMLRSSRSRTFGGFLANQATVLSHTDAEKVTIGWANFVKNSERAGLTEDFSGDTSGSDDGPDGKPAADALNADRGDYRGF